MSKDKDKGTNGKKAQAKLEKARERLEELEAALLRTQAKGEKRVREAQAKAEKSLARARERVEAQREIVAKREARAAEEAPALVAGDLHSPDAAADRLASESNGARADGQGESIILPGSAGDTT
jgi:ElaB/YqjD/DUF883 family membrane-anchored ribosome-binding protein